MEKLIFPGHIGTLECIMPALQVYVEANDWVKTSDYIDREFAILKANGIETEMKEDKTDYTKDAELPRYFGFIERQTPGDIKSDCRITELGKSFYNAIKNDNQSDINESLMTAFETVTFGKNNDGCPGSNTCLEAPNILLLASLLLDGVSRQEYAGILYEMLYNNASIVNALVKIKLCRINKNPITNKVRVDNKVVPFLVNVGFLTDSSSLIKLTTQVINDYHDRIANLPTTNNIQRTYPLQNMSNSSNLEGVNDVYDTYFSALRTKPFMLLAGVSGTGKSRIVRKFAQASVTKELQGLYDSKSVEKGFNRWELHKPANFELIQVKPNWHNSLEVVGYKSNIGGAHYEFTPFVEFVVRAWKHPDVPFFLCLDEMNLAPVEQYFAEFLSAIESRSIENGEYETDPIIKPFKEFGDEVCDKMLDHLIGKVGASKIKGESLEARLVERFTNKGLTLPQNLLVLGTVNMDETTFSFSRKVLDRAMSVVMNDVNYDSFFDGKTENDVEEMDDITIDLLNNRPLRGVKTGKVFKKDVQDHLTKINKILRDTPFKLGYRAANEALLYVSAAHDFNPGIDTKTALDEFTMMKILSRIEGDKRSIGTLLDDLQTVITTDYQKSNDKLVKMAKTLNDKQFVSYWS